MTLKEAAAAVRRARDEWTRGLIDVSEIGDHTEALLALCETDAMPDLEARGFARGIEMAARVCDAERPHAFIAGDLARDIRALSPTDAVLVPRATLERWIRAEPLTAELADEMSALLNPNPKGTP